MSHNDYESLMRQALSAAQKSQRLDVHPNPRVGAALLSKDGTVISHFHERFGGPHAEMHVLNLAKKNEVSTEGATLAVTLEPCSHFGKTPPCADALIEAKIKTVLVGIKDPFEKVSGQGIEKLKNAGIEVIESVLDYECQLLNKEWLFAHKHKRPFVYLKMATSLDGLWNAPNEKWITGPKIRAYCHKLRSHVDALVTGTGTVKSDNPELTARREDGTLYDFQPKVFVLTKKGNFSLDSYKLSQHPNGCVVKKIETLKIFLSELFKNNIFQIQIEAGPTLSQAFIHEGLVDELWHCIAPKVFADQSENLENSFLNIVDWNIVSTENFDTGDILQKFVPKKSLK